jgi:hypothetical protein
MEALVSKPIQPTIEEVSDVVPEIKVSSWCISVGKGARADGICCMALGDGAVIQTGECEMCIRPTLTLFQIKEDSQAQYFLTMIQTLSSMSVLYKNLYGERSKKSRKYIRRVMNLILSHLRNPQSRVNDVQYSLA